MTSAGFFTRIQSYLDTPLNRRLFWIVLFGTLLRIVLMPLASETYDVSVWYYLANDVLKGFGIYSSHTFTYPPLWAYTFLPLIRLLALSADPRSFGLSSDEFASEGILPGSLQPIASSSFITAMKLPLLAADILATVLIYRIVSELSGRDRAISSVGLWILSPSIIWTSFGHGQFDILPAFLTLLSSYLFFRRHLLYAGTALSLAALYKLYPILFLPLYLAMLFVRQKSNAEAGRKAMDFLKFLSGLAAPALFFTIAPSSNGFLGSLGSRGGLIPLFGGFSPFSLLNLPQLMNARQTLIINSQLLSGSVLSIQIALSVFVGIMMARRAKEDPYRANLLGHIAILVIVLVTSPLTNPQYIVWMLPFLTVFCGVKGYLLIRTLILSAVGFLFNLVWVGPGYFFYPTAIAYGIPSIASLASLNEAFSLFTLPATIICQFVGFVTLISCLKPDLSNLRLRLMSQQAPHLIPEVRAQLRSGATITRTMNNALKLSLVFLIASVVWMGYDPSLTSAPNLVVTGVDVRGNSTIIHAETQLRLMGGTYPAQISTLLVPLRTGVNRPPIYVYYDPSYPSSLTDLRGWTGILDHLPFELQQRKYPSGISRVDAKGLAHVLDLNETSAVVIPSGVFPSTTNITRLKSFLQNGGTLFWIGDRIGYYSSKPALILDESSPENPGYSAQQELFNGLIVSKNFTSLHQAPSQIRPPYDAGDLRTNLSKALNLNYPATTVGASLSALSTLGGFAIGRINTKTNQTSIAVVPVGVGRVVLFGGGVTYQFASSGETTIAADIAQIMASALLDSTFDFAAQTQTLLPYQTANATITLSLNTTKLITGILFLAYSPDPHIAFFHVELLPLPP